MSSINKDKLIVMLCYLPKIDSPKIDSPKIDSPKSDSPKSDSPKSDSQIKRTDLT